jgi:FixJ family two-component response regulator
MSGLQLQQRLLRLGARVPVIFMTACDDREGRMRAQALHAGALAFLRKPFPEVELLTAVYMAIAS